MTLDLVNLRPLMSLTSGRSEIVVGMVDGPVAADHPDLAQPNIQGLPGKMGAACAQMSSAACVHGTFVAGILSARRIGGASDLPGLHPAREPGVFGDGGRKWGPAKRHARGACSGNPRMHRGPRPDRKSEPRSDPIVPKGRARAEACSRSCCAPRRHNRGGCRQSGHSWRHGHHGSSLGYRGGGMRRQRQTPQWVQSRVFHWVAWPPRPRRRRHQPGGGRPVADPWRNERGCAVRDRRCRPGVVPATGGEWSPNSPGVPTGARSRTSLRDAPAAGCMGRLPTLDRELSHDRR